MKRWMLMWVLCSAALSAMATDTLRVRVLGFPPLTYQDAQGRWIGLDVELAQLVLAEAGITPVYQIAPWKRALAQLETGDIDLMMNLSITEERKKYIHFFGPSRDEVMVMVVPENSNYRIEQWDDFKAVKGKVGIQTGSYYGAAFDKKFKSDPDFAAKFEPRATSESNIKKLNADRIAGWFDDVYAMTYLMRNDAEFANLKFHPFVINRDAVYFGVSKKSVSPETIKRLEQAYARVKASGKLDAILKRYK